MSPSVGLVVPAYRPDVERLVAFLERLEERVAPAALRVELDAPTAAVRDALTAAPGTVHAVDRRRGKGAAVTCGFEHLDTDVLAFADADGSTPAESVADVLAATEGGVDLAVGSRRHPGADVRSHQTLARRRLGDAFAWLARRFLDVDLYDYQCGAKALTTETWAAVRPHLYEAGFAWDVELIAMAGALNRRVVEVPVVWEDHPDSTVSATDAVPELFGALVASNLRSRHLQGRPLDGLGSASGRPLVERPGVCGDE